MRSLETPEQTAHRILGELRDSLRRAGRRTFRYSRTIDDLYLTLGAKAPPAVVDDAGDLPPELRSARRYLQLTYRAVRDLRAAAGPDGQVWPRQILARVDEEDPDRIHSLDTVNHCLRDLVALRLAHSDTLRGWRLGSAQPALPIFGGQTSAPSVHQIREYSQGMAGNGVRRFQRSPLLRQWVWVPGEKSDYGVVIRDAETGEEYAARDETGEMRVRNSSGRLRTVAAARLLLLEALDGGESMVVRIDDHRVTVRVLGEWQLRGLTSPEGETAAAGAS